MFKAIRLLVLIALLGAGLAGAYLYGHATEARKRSKAHLRHAPNHTQDLHSAPINDLGTHVRHANTSRHEDGTDRQDHYEHPHHDQEHQGHQSDHLHK